MMKGLSSSALCTRLMRALTEHHIMQNLFISEEEVTAYYNAHPIKKEPAFLVQTASVSLAGKDEQEQKQLRAQINGFVRDGAGLSVDWSPGYWVKKSELTAQLQSFEKKDIGAIISMESGKDVHLYRLLNKKPERLVPLEKRYKKIVEILRKPKYEELLSDYRKRLLDGATVVYLEQ